jgi:hypothetical protein
MADTDKSLYNLRYNQVTSNLEAFGGGSPQWTQITLNNVDPTQVPVTRQINTTAPLMGGGNLTSDRTISIPQAMSSVDGFLSGADWIVFNGKLSPALASANLFVGNGSNVAVGVPLSGDAMLSNTGTLTLQTVNGNVGSFTNANITVDAKGRITAATSGSSGITQLTGDVTAGPGSGSQVATLATVNGNVGSFTYASITVNAKGLITAASSGTAPVTSVSGTAGDISSTGGTTPIIDLVSTAVTPATYTNATVTVDSKGRITSASSGSSGITQLTGDVTAGPGSGSQVATLATVNGSPGTTTLSTITTNGKGLVTSNSSATTTGSGSVVLATSPTLVTPALGTPSSVTLTNGTGLPIVAGTTGTLTVARGGTGQITLSAFVPTVQKFTSGSGTYTTPAGVTWIRVTMVGGGGGGGGGGSAGGTGGTGGNTTFGTTLLTANGGGGGTGSGTTTGGTGGTASLGSGPVGNALQGGTGEGSGFLDSAGRGQSGSGASSPFGGAGTAVWASNSATAAISNTGSGGGSGGGGTTTPTGAGGGAGGYVDAIITSPSATYSYSVGAAGTAGAAGGGGGVAGAPGGSGLIIVEEHYI